jgi:hypothetical protein
MRINVMTSQHYYVILSKVNQFTRSMPSSIMAGTVQPGNWPIGGITINNTTLNGKPVKLQRPKINRNGKRC